ncbi:MAG: DedA family protein [OCS116 cluster bacterium]|nr:DedA family protein [OCS116 cluster bacterium]
MTEIILGLIPEYGLYIIFFTVLFACFGIPLPSSILVLTSGALAAAGDLIIWQVVLVATIAYWLGDQLAFAIARFTGPSLLTLLRKIQRIKPVLDRSETMLKQHGWVAIFLSHTIFSPTGPYVSYVSGAVKTNWLKFTAVAMPSSTLWTISYAMLGYFFAGELPQMSDLVASMLIVAVFTTISIAFVIWLVVSWRHFEA